MNKCAVIVIGRGAPGEQGESVAFFAELQWKTKGANKSDDVADAALCATRTISSSGITERSTAGDLGFHSFDSAARTIQDIETVNILREG
jgi:hypothetical protein